MQPGIQWYPGHMAKARRLLNEKLGLVDVVIELLDSRVPLSSRNPDINKLLGGKPRVIVLNKVDLADTELTGLWIQELNKSQSCSVIGINSVTGTGVKELIDACRKAARARLDAEAAKGRLKRPIRIMVVGIPNVGKSSLINKMVNRGSAKVGNKPGVTRGAQWVRIRDDIELIDTPGLLWPKFDDQSVGIKLALTGAVSLDVVNVMELAESAISLLSVLKPGALHERYKGLQPLEHPMGAMADNGEEISDSFLVNILEGIGRARGYILSGGKVDIDRASFALVQDFRDGQFGRLTLDLPFSRSGNV